MRLQAILLLMFALTGSAQVRDSAYLRKSTFEDRPAMLFSNNKMELTVLVNGGAFASLMLRDDPEGTSPFWNPARMAREIGQKSNFGVMGHFVCVDGFGPVSTEERAAGMPGHGEAHTVPWEVQDFGREGRTATVTFRARLPLVHELFTRTLRMVDGENVIYVDSQLESELAFDHPVCWAEHATIGSPFLLPGITVVDMSARKAITRAHDPKPPSLPYRLASLKDFTWPMAPGVHGGKIDLRAAPAHPNSLDHTACLMDTSRRLEWVTAVNTEKHLILGYVFKRDEYPWLQNWEYYPRNLKMARGLEFSTQPFDVPRREVIQLNSMFGAPVYRWLPAKSRIGTQFLLFYAKTPEGFRKVDDVRLEGGQLVVVDRKAGKQITLAASLRL